MDDNDIIRLAIAMGQDPAVAAARLDAARVVPPAPKKTDIIGSVTNVDPDGNVKVFDIMGDGKMRLKAG